MVLVARGDSQGYMLKKVLSATLYVLEEYVKPWNDINTALSIGIVVCRKECEKKTKGTNT